jgi:hypothetical protein
MCSIDGYLFSHEGLCKKWLEPNICNFFAELSKMSMTKSSIFTLSQKACLYPNESLVFKTRGSFLMFLVNRLFKSSEIRRSQQQKLQNDVLSRWSHPNLFRIFLTPERCMQQIIKYIQFMFVRNELELGVFIDYLYDFFDNFSRTQHIEAIDMIAILNTMRTKQFSFEFAFLKWHLCFSEKTKIKCGQTTMMIEVTSRVITDQIIKLYRTLKPREQDLVGLMHLELCEGLKKKLYPKPSFPRFEVTVDKPYDYWNEHVRWESEQYRYVLSCLVSSFIRQPYFSKKVSERSRFTPKSLENFFKGLFDLRYSCMPGFEDQMKVFERLSRTWIFWELRSGFDV